METIKCAAIQYYLKGDDTPRVTYGPHHAYCIEFFSFAEIRCSDRQMDKEIQGFLTSSDRFVDRAEAYQIAKAAGQLVKEDARCILDSYNVRYL